MSTDDVIADSLGIPRHDPDEGVIAFCNRIAAALEIDGFELDPTDADLAAFDQRASAAIALMRAQTSAATSDAAELRTEAHRLEGELAEAQLTTIALGQHIVAARRALDENRAEAEIDLGYQDRRLVRGADKAPDPREARLRSVLAEDGLDAFRAELAAMPASRAGTVNA